MYHRGGDRGWHRGQAQRDIPPPRPQHSRPYRGSYNDHREHDNYGSYHENHYMEYPEQSYTEYYEENQPYNEYREHREPVYNRGGRHDNSYHKEKYYHGSYQRGRGEHARYRGTTPEAPHKKYSYNPSKAYKKENEIQVKSSTTQPVQKVNHNPGPTIVTLTPGITEDDCETKSLKAISAEQDTKPLQDCEKPSHETEKPEGVKKEDVKMDSLVKESKTPPSDHKKETSPACSIKTEITNSKKEETRQTEQLVKEEPPTSVNPGKRAHSEERDFVDGVQQRERESVQGKRLCSNLDRDEHYLEKTVQIPLLDCWGDMPPESAVSASTSEQENAGSAANFILPVTAQEMRTAFILARKERIEEAFAQDCKTFAFVASTFLKKDPSIETAVTSALRSSLQEMAGLCVQELNNFIDSYDSAVLKDKHCI